MCLEFFNFGCENFVPERIVILRVALFLQGSRGLLLGRNWDKGMFFFPIGQHLLPGKKARDCFF